MNLKKVLLASSIAAIISTNFILAAASNKNKSAPSVIEVQQSQENKEIAMIAKTMPAVPIIYSENSKGAGVFIDENYILTAYHVIENNDVTVALQNSKQTQAATVVKIDQWNDLALIKLNEPTSTPLETISLAKQLPLTGETVYGFGHPRTVTYSVTKGIISNNDQAIAGLSKLQFDGQIHPGYSGGPLTNTDGEIVGIITNLLKDKETQENYYGVSFATPLKTIQAFLQDY